MEKKHTQGKWRYSKYLQRITVSPNKGYVRSADTVCLFPEFTEGGEEVIDANAELICTAVNSYYPMLEALNDGRDALSDIINAADNGQAYSPEELASLFVGAYNKMHEAIAIALAENKQ